MNVELQNELAKLVKTTNDTTIGIVQMIKEKVPDLCRQIVNYEIGCSCCAILISMMLIPFGLYLTSKRCKIIGNEDKGFFSGLLVIICVSVLIFGIGGLIKPVFAPDLVVVDYVKGFMK